MIALSDNPSIPRSGADDYCPENMSKKLLRSLYIIKWAGGIVSGFFIFLTVFATITSRATASAATIFVTITSRATICKQPTPRFFGRLISSLFSSPSNSQKVCSLGVNALACF